MRRAAVVLGCALVALAGCAGSGTVRRLGDESRLNHERLAELNRGTEELRSEVAALRAQLEGLRRDLDGALRERDRVQREGLDELGKRAAATDKRVENLAGAVRAVEQTMGGLADQVARLEAVSSTGGARRDRGGRSAARTASLAADDLFNRAMESFKGGELAQAIIDFEDFVARYPSHPLAGSAQFWIGEAYYNARDYQHATAEYRKALDLAPKGEKAPEALFKLGLAHRALKRADRAREVWAQLLRDFPQSEAAQKARLAQREVSRAPKPSPGGDTR
ncbi:MAG TPA: tol-pal system protein YbgF [Methylomirabilota bacterium]|jgi:tol-pal system protein YbgF|nr:tol-pal system protein YbgF [Methylomirabilota bacterium]